MSILLNITHVRLEISSLTSEHGSDSWSTNPNFQLQMPTIQQQWRQLRINIEAYAGSYNSVFNETYFKHDDLSSIVMHMSQGKHE